MAGSQILNAPKTPYSPKLNSKRTPPSQWRRPGPANTETKAKPNTSALVLELHDGEELLFQFYGRGGWPLAEQLGTVSMGQAVLAEKKLAKLSRTRKVSREVNFEYKLWGRTEVADTEEEGGSSEEEDEQSSSSSNGAHSSNGKEASHDLASISNGAHSSNINGASSELASSSNGAYSAESNDSLRELNMLDSSSDGPTDGVGGAGRGRVRFWRFSREDAEGQQPSETSSSGISNGWTVLDDSSNSIFSVDASEPIDSSGTTEQESSDQQPGTISDSRAGESSSRGGDKGAADAIRPPKEAELRQSPAFTSEHQGHVIRRRSGLVGLLTAALASLNAARAKFLRGCTGALRMAFRDLKAAWFACLYLTRAAWWAVKGKPRPPKFHASPTLARLRVCRNEKEASRVSLGAGFDTEGKMKAPLADMPRWRVEALVGTHVCDMGLYRRALTSPTAVDDIVGCSYERLEYVGDAVLGLIIREYIYSKYPGVTEHAMCTMVSTLVSGRTLHDFARGLHLEHYLALNADDQWAMRGMGGYAGGMLADAFEALLGALFMDRGYPAARAFLLRLVEEVVDMERLPLNRDYKGVLGNIMRLRGMGRAVYRSRAHMGTPDPATASYPLVPRAPAGGGPHLIWVCRVSAGGIVASGADIHRPTAEQQAARAALEALGAPLEELSLVEADQLTMLDIARSLPDLPDMPQPSGGYASAMNGSGSMHAGSGGNRAGSNGSGRAARRALARRGLK